VICCCSCAGDDVPWHCHERSAAHIQHSRKLVSEQQLGMVSRQQALASCSIVVQQQQLLLQVKGVLELNWLISTTRLHAGEGCRMHTALNTLCMVEQLHMRQRHILAAV
jgi:hypothetical protein